MTKTSKSADESFKSLPALLWVIMIGVITLYEVVCYQPSLLPCDSLGHFGDRICYIANGYHSALEIGFWVLGCIHLVEAIYAGSICRELNLETEAQIKWLLQTFVLGFPSLRLLLKMRKVKQK